jgi:hypothetical protein
VVSEVPVELVVTLAIYAVLWQGYRIRQRLTGFGQTALLVSIVTAVANPALQRMIEAGWFGEVDAGAARFYGAVIVVVGTVAIYLFRLAVDGHRPTDTRTIRFVVLSAALLAIWTGLFTLATVRGDTMLYGPAAFAHTPGLLYFATTGPYLFLVRLLIIVWIVRRTRSDDVGPALRWGVRVAGLGLLTSGTVSLLRAIPPIMILFGGPVTAAPGWMLYVASTVGSPLIFVGLSFPLLVDRLAALRAWWRDRRAFLHIEPLWTLSSTAYPDLVLPSTGPVGYRLQRRRVECLDAVARATAPTDGRPADDAAAVDRLRTAIDVVEREHLGGRRLWAALGPHRDPGPDPGVPSDGAGGSSPGEQELLRRLADTVRADDDRYVSAPRPRPRP